MSNKRWSTWPAGLLVGLSAQVVAAWIGAIGLLADGHHFERWFTVATAGVAAGMLLAATGSLELARRLPGVRARAAQVGALGFGLVALALVTLDFAAFAGVQSELMMIDQLPWVILVGFIVAGISLAAAARMAPLGAALVFIALLIAPPPPIAETLADTLGKDMIVFIASALTIWVALALVIIRYASREAAAAPESNAATVLGLRRAQTALWIRLGSASLLSSGAGFQVMSVQKFTLVAGSIAGALAMVIFAIAMLGVAGNAGPDHPRTRLNVATFLALWSAIAWSLQALFNYHHVGSVPDDASAISQHFAAFAPDAYDGAPTWFLTAPIVAAVGITVLISAIEKLARTSGDEKLLRTASSTKVIFLMITSLSLLLLGVAGPKISTGLGHLYALVFGTSFGVGGLVLAASLCGKAAKSIEDRPGLATATLRTGDPG